MRTYINANALIDLILKTWPPVPLIPNAIGLSGGGQMADKAATDTLQRHLTIQYICSDNYQASL